jgi:hypothetical protein
MGSAFQQVVGFRGQLGMVFAVLSEELGDVSSGFSSASRVMKKAGSPGFFTNQLEAMFKIGGQIPVVLLRRSSGGEAFFDDGVDGLLFQDDINTMILDKVKLYGFGLFIKGFDLFEHFFDVGHLPAISIGNQRMRDSVS